MPANAVYLVVLVIVVVLVLAVRGIVLALGNNHCLEFIPKGWLLNQTATLLNKIAVTKN